MARTKQVYLSNDGTEFDTELEADAHDKALEMASSVDTYVKGAVKGKAASGLIRKHIPGYAAWVAAGCPVFETADDVEEEEAAAA